MNNLLKQNNMKTNGFFSHRAMRHSLISTVFLVVFTTSAVANRPAMDTQDEAANVSETPSQTQAEQNRPQQHHQTETNAPSAVEVMMQQQGQLPQQHGDVMQLPAKEMQPGETLKIQLLDYPRRGMSMEKVQQEYGQPMATSESVGQPPISSWTYSDRVVYFEYSTVLHVVAR